MSEETEEILEEEGVELTSEELMKEHLSEIDAAFAEASFFQRLGKVIHGIGKPHSTREFKEARTELQRLIAPLLAIIFPIVFIIVLCVMTDITGMAKRKIDVEIARTQEDDAPLEEEQQEQEIEQPDDMEVDIEIDTPNDMPTQVTEVVQPSLTTTPTDQLKQPDANAVTLIKSPVVLNNGFATRTSASRNAALKKYGGDARTEAAVMAALRWLKTVQRPDGSWAGSTGADNQGVTGLVILTYLAHGEKSGGGTEFGGTVSRGLEWLMNRANAEALDQVGTHALAEAYGFLKNPNLKASATHAVRTMVDKLVATKWGPDDEKGENTRPHLLRMAFQTMALSSARLSGILPPNYDAAMVKLREGFLIQGNQQIGGFSSDYYGPPRPGYRRTGIWHSMVGVVGLQYLGSGDLPIIEKTMKILDDDWEDPTLSTIDSSCCPVRGNYWATMVFFNGGGKRWKQWNAKMINIYCKGQTIIPNSYTDHTGIQREMGYWTCEDMHIGTKPIAPTCWVALQLMVYYRYLPTSSKSGWQSAGKSAAPAEEKKEEKPAVDIEVDI